MNEIIANVNNWLGIIGFIITLATLLMTLNIRGRIEQTLGKQRYIEQRDIILSKLQQIRTRLNGEIDKNRNCLADDMPPSIFLDLRALILQLKRFKVWRKSDREELDRFIATLSSLISGTRSDNPARLVVRLVLRLDVVIAIVEANSVF